MRPSQRECEQLRNIKLTRQYTKHAEGSVLIESGNTKVICTASVVNSVPNFLRGKDQGWLTAEYGMLPRATHTRTNREAARGKQTGRTMEIQRLIGRALRAAVNLRALGDYTINIDCDVIQADGGTRTASITGACVALYDAIQTLKNKHHIKADPFVQFVAAISVGIFKDTPVLDLDYDEDCNAQTDMNIVMTEHGEFIEVQGTAEDKAFSEIELTKMLGLAKKGITDIIQLQKECVQAK